MLQGIDESCQQMARLIEQTLDFARGRLGGGITLERKPLADIRPIIDQAVREVRRAHPTRIIELALGDGLSATVDEVKLHQLISNLVGNAVQHSPAGSPVEVKAERRNGIIELEVKNAGKPLPTEMVGHTFSPFVRRVDGKKNAGLGLGLYIASEIAKGHGGQIEAASVQGSTIFTVTLPLAE
jgi:sigma-B regulation protein RsbU (phosphoserine phosphatase)